MMKEETHVINESVPLVERIKHTIIFNTESTPTIL